MQQHADIPISSGALYRGRRIIGGLPNKITYANAKALVWIISLSGCSKGCEAVF